MRKFGILTAVLLCLTGRTLAQKKAGNMVFRKEVVRIVVDSFPNDQAEHHLRDVSSDSSLYEVIAAAVRSEKIKAYADGLKKIRTVAEIDAMLEQHRVMEEVEDPVTGETKRVTRHMGEPTWGFHTFKVMEEWAFYPSTGKTEIKIEGIGPVYEEFNLGSGKIEYRTLFWVKFNDVKDVLARYAAYRPQSSFQNLIWDDYFPGDVKRK